MSPEQARGKSVDKRSDIWAFGCVLYEMLTGHKAFHRETVSDTIAAILEREPDWRLLPAATPTTVRRLLQRCLEKDVSRRLRDIGDACLEIEDAIGRFGSRSLPRRLFDFGRERWLAAAGAVVAASIALIAAWFWPTWPLRPPPPRGPAPDLHADHLSIRTRVVSQSLAGRQMGCVWCDTEGNRDIILQSTTGQTPINLTPDSARRRRSAGVLARRRAYRLPFEPRRRWNLRHGPHGRGGQAADAARVQADVGARRSRTRVHDRERRPGSAEHAGAELVVGRRRGVWRRTATRKRRRRIAKLVAARAPHRLHDERRDRGQYAAGYLDRRSLRRESGCRHHRRCAELESRVGARWQTSLFRQRSWRADQFVARADRRNIRENDRPSRSGDDTRAVCCPHHDFGRRDADRLQLDSAQPQYPEAPD